jgi:hypothetical protein
LVAGCGGVTKLTPTADSPTAVPPEPSGETGYFVDDLEAVCDRGYALPYAAKYAGEVHPLVEMSGPVAKGQGVLDRLGVAVEGKQYVWRSWNPLQLVVCVDFGMEDEARKIAECRNYNERIDIYARTMNVKVVIATTGETLEEKTFVDVPIPTQPCEMGTNPWLWVDPHATPPYRRYVGDHDFAGISKYVSDLRTQPVK